MFLHCPKKPPGSPPTPAPWTWIWRSSSQRFRHQVGCHRPRPTIARTAPGRFHWDFFGKFWISLIIWLPGAQTCRIWYEYYLIYLFMTFTIQTIRFFAMMIWCLYGALAAIWWIWLPSSMIFHNVSSTLFLFVFWRVLWGVKHIHSFTVNFTPWASHLIQHPVEVPQSHGLTDHLSIFSWLAKISGSAIVKSQFRWWNPGVSNWNSHFSPLNSQFLLLKLPGLFQPGHIGEFLFQLHTGCLASSLHGRHEHGATSGTFGEPQQHVEGPFATLGHSWGGGLLIHQNLSKLDL